MRNEESLRREVAVAGRTCALDGCEGAVTARGWCTKHYARYRRYGDANFRIKGEIRDGCKICPACREDVAVEGYTPNSSYCRKCVASIKRSKPRPETTPLPAIFCIQCARQFIPGKKSIYCCSSGCTKAREAAMDKFNLAMRGRDAANASGRKWYSQNKAMAFDNSARYRARKIGAFVENVERDVVLDRDEWVCQLCGEPISRVLKSPHALSPSIDHRIPLARGGMHSYANCQAAHLGCNTSKGARID